MTNDKILPHQQRIMDMLKEEGLSPTGRTVRSEPELQHFVSESSNTTMGSMRSALLRRIQKIGVFAAMYGSPPPVFNDVHLLKGRLDYLDEFRFTDGEPKEEWLGEGPEQDFNKAKTPKKQLEARLHKKDKPKVSSLLSKLVKKT